LTAIAFSTVSVSLSGLGVGTAFAAPDAPDQKASQKVSLFVFPKGRFAAAEAALLQSLLRAQLEKLVATRAAGPGAEPVRSLESLVGVSIENGFRALNDRKAAVALENFEKAYQTATAWEGPISKRLMARMTKGLGAARIMLGDIGPGQELIENSLNLIPDQQISEYGWTLDLRTAFNELLERRVGLEPGALDIDVLPEGAVVRVDGELKGFSPLQVGDLSPGRHWVEAGADGYRWQGMFVDVPAGDSSIHAVELMPVSNAKELSGAISALEKAISRGSAASQMADAQALMKSDVVMALEVGSTNSDYVFSGYIKEGNGAPRKLSAQFPKDGTFVARARSFLAQSLKVAESEDDSLLSLDGPPQTSIMAAGELVIDPNDPIFKSETGKKQSSVTDEWWFWAIVGGVTAGVVAGSVVLFSGSDGGGGPTGRVLVNVNALR